ncbi:MAG TPA: aspartyl-phosphate phosphatase Spo0E family protein [Candidatus Merdicola faecigallinarum]|uniref:Aspartyl-phosphate phosphatase Spo0E family protein n=1 Tax=Candidatus Merdicola faecigallinarum TaxID=2840862 RepID=A0A9D1M178_9FIRM|nr:aspartyl-phosphate phosphatase Spo0E family protein [Candidatus Merdicola faecigallinarum]
MLNEEICKVREKLNQSILNEDNYERIYQISVELDELIARYYRRLLEEEYSKC